MYFHCYNLLLFKFLNQTLGFSAFSCKVRDFILNPNIQLRKSFDKWTFPSQVLLTINNDKIVVL